MTSSINLTAGFENPPFNLDVKSAVISNYSKQMIREFEGYRSAPYKDVAGNWTVGYGHKLIKPDSCAYTIAQCEVMLDSDIRIASEPVRNLVTVKVTQGQFDALIDWCFNMGGARFVTSRIWRQMNAGNIRGAADELALYYYAADKVQPGLIKRRQWEKAMFLLS